MFLYEEHLILNKHIERLQPLEHFKYAKTVICFSECKHPINKPSDIAERRFDAFLQILTELVGRLQV